MPAARWASQLRMLPRCHAALRTGVSCATVASVGAWDAGPFGNDAAGDFVADLAEMSDASAVSTRLDQALSVQSAQEYIEAPAMSEAVAAAAVVALQAGAWVPRRVAGPSHEWLKAMSTVATTGRRASAARVFRRAFNPVANEWFELWSEASAVTEARSALAPYIRAVDDLVPSHKSDAEGARRAVAAGWPAVEPVIDLLLEWLQDLNWTVAPLLVPLLRSVGEPLAPYLRAILQGDDDVWKSLIVLQLLVDGDTALVESLRDVLSRIADHPTQGETEEDLAEYANDALSRSDR